jgi:hypothetical protein
MLALPKNSKACDDAVSLARNVTATVTGVPKFATVTSGLPGTPRATGTEKAELLASAKRAIECGERSLRDAAEALGRAQNNHGATQREMAKAVSISIGWVNRLLKWRQSGYKGASPFGPTTRQGSGHRSRQSYNYRHGNKRKHDRTTQLTIMELNDDKSAQDEAIT